jgi:hypothetical protein
LWLKGNNPKYHNIVISKNNLDNLPLGDIPLELPIQTQVDCRIVNNEWVSHVPGKMTSLSGDNTIDLDDEGGSADEVLVPI